LFDIKSYQRAESIQAAIRLLMADERNRLIAGGTDILVKLHKGRSGFGHLVDIHDLPELKTIRRDDQGTLAIGASCSFTQVSQDPLVIRHVPFLAEAIHTIGGPQLRNMATIGGNICNGVPSADSVPSLLALDAVLTIDGPKGLRQLPLQDFFRGPGRVALRPGEVLVTISIAQPNYTGFCGHYYKYAMRRAMDIATIGCAAVCKVEGDRLYELRLALGVAAPIPIRCPHTEARAAGQVITPALLDRIAKWVLDDVSPRTSWRASQALRLHIIQTLAKRVVARTISDAGKVGCSSECGYSHELLT
jgi:xanthine dehydrogenase FAD-binding subunit